MMNSKFNIKRVIYSNPWTHIIWEDGTKTSAKCDKEDTYDELTGFLMCVFKKKMSPKKMRKMFDNYVYGNDKKYIKRDNKNKTPKPKDYEGLTKPMRVCRTFPKAKEKPTYNWIIPYDTSWGWNLYNCYLYNCCGSRGNLR